MLGITVHDATRLGVTRFLIYCGHPGGSCGHCGYIPADSLPADLRIKTLEPRCRCTKCGTLGASVRPDYGH
jgi:hypothetical protein